MRRCDEANTYQEAANVDEISLWRKFFQHWPAKLPQRGLIVTRFDEQFPFNGYLIAGDLLMLERKTPDNLGARKMLLPISQVAAVKIIDPIKGDLFKEFGFQGQLPEGA
jgi:hypothetical protein